MIVYDGIIFSLQTKGGISVLFEQLFERHMQREVEFCVLGYGGDFGAPACPRFNYDARFMERYRNVDFPPRGNIFHSTYYRLPDRSSNFKVVTTVHDYVYERHSLGLKRLVHSWQKNAAIRGSDAVICVSESTRADLLTYSRGVREDSVFVVPNGVSDDYHPINGLERESQVLFVGARAGYKNFFAAVIGVSLVPDLTLVCVGGGAFSSTELDTLNKYIPGRYRHAGFISNAQLNLEYNRSLCLIYPSLYEGFGIPVIEAMRAGCPVVAVARSSIPEVCGNAALLVDEGIPEEFSEAIQRYMCEDFRARMTILGFQQASKFSWDVTYEKTLAIYKNLI